MRTNADSFVQDTGFRSVGSLAVFASVVVWHVGGVFAITGGLPPRPLGEVGFLLCRYAFFLALALVPVTLALSFINYFRPSKRHFDYHGPILALLAPCLMIGEAFLIFVSAGIR